MEYRDKIKWLSQYQTALSRQQFLEGEIETLRSDAERMTAAMGGMPGRSGPNAPRGGTAGGSPRKAGKTA